MWLSFTHFAQCHSQPSLPLSLSLSLPPSLSVSFPLSVSLLHSFSLLTLLYSRAFSSLPCPPACNAINLRKNFCHLLNWKFLAAGQLIPFAVIDSSTQTRLGLGLSLPNTLAHLQCSLCSRPISGVEVSLMLARMECNAIRLIDSPLASSKLCIHRIYCWFLIVQWRQERRHC